MQPPLQSIFTKYLAIDLSFLSPRTSAYMDHHKEIISSSGSGGGEDAKVRKGPWTMEEDLILINYIANHGQGVWNTLAKSAGLKRTGKSCRLRWLNYLTPDVRRGNITPEEQLLIMELQSRWGNKWSKIARQLPGRTDNEIKNFWRTRIQKKPNKQTESFDYSNDASTSRSNSIEDVAMTDPPPQTSYEMHHDDMNIGDVDATNGAFATSTSFVADSSENFWTVENFWSMQPMNGD